MSITSFRSLLESPKGDKQNVFSQSSCLINLINRISINIKFVTINLYLVVVTILKSSTKYLQTQLEQQWLIYLEAWQRHQNMSCRFAGKSRRNFSPTLFSQLCRIKRWNVRVLKLSQPAFFQVTQMKQVALQLEDQIFKSAFPSKAWAVAIVINKNVPLKHISAVSNLFSRIIAEHLWSQH